MTALRRLLTPVVVLAALVGVYLLVRDQGAEAARAFARADAAPLLAASVLANIAGLVLAVHAWRVLIPGDHPIRGLRAAKIYFLGQLSKYVPGRVWGVLTHIAHGREAGVPAARMTSAYVLSLALTLLTGAAVGLAAAPAALPGQWYWLCPPALLFLAGLVRPALLTRPVTALTRLARRPVDPPPDTAVRRAVLLALASWTASGLHLWFLLLAIGAPPWAGLGAAVGGFALATVVSSLAVIVPDGWGVRELTLTAALATVLPGGLAAAAAIASRLVCVLAELGSSAVVLAWSRLRDRTPRTVAPPTRTPSRASTPVPTPHPYALTAPIGEEVRVHP
ncbi:lysylphosphatidylglycerol synthase domain-containing protein [Streptomyces sp. CC208A]|uniref:lysylphosphatidylglycerol synthase domain-containing protein n=1 Tax=Streptomyces sp. CC208A TaxID=3044573 RepID=UPI0024A89E15|nr:lysylphosphatidylglycerol synthase domain-containing protein [Streptomyces sp. CC208A]